jgi:hypothetical protein
MHTWWWDGISHPGQRANLSICPLIDFLPISLSDGSISSERQNNTREGELVKFHLKSDLRLRALVCCHVQCCCRVCMRVSLCCVDREFALVAPLLLVSFKKRKNSRTNNSDNTEQKVKHQTLLCTRKKAQTWLMYSGATTRNVSCTNEGGCSTTSASRHDSR